MIKVIVTKFEKITQGQYQTSEWHEYKRGAISASRAHSIMIYVNIGHSNGATYINQAFWYDREGMKDSHKSRLLKVWYR